MTVQDLIREARELAEKATDGVWEIRGSDGYGEILAYGRASVALVQNPYDAAFIARSRSLVPALAAALESVTAEYAAWREGKRGVEEHLALIEENKRLKAEIAELRERDRWVPVSERLPELTEEDSSNPVLVAIKYKYDLETESPTICVGYVLDGDWWTFMEHSCNRVGSDTFSHGDKVTHWRPLPALPMGETKGAD